MLSADWLLEVAEALAHPALAHQPTSVAKYRVRLGRHRQPPLLPLSVTVLASYATNWLFPQESAPDWTLSEHRMSIWRKPYGADTYQRSRTCRGRAQGHSSARALQPLLRRF